ncbi:hypothetical protein E2C01_067559 [Portunus trituberculatus]|uniref:Uncharacterized protein n=1 Tax=Portunus trituberculatus TaxID=210409 RepID=A0A5B7HVD7_PORTR|nr:hypothetical protein [Portunus trituberculatus]
MESFEVGFIGALVQAWSGGECQTVLPLCLEFSLRQRHSGDWMCEGLTRPLTSPRTSVRV